MISILTDVVAFQLVTIPLVVGALFLVRERRPRYAIVFLALFALDTAVLAVPSVLDLHPAGLEWNWIGKFAGVAWVALFIWVSPFSANDIGATLRYRPGTVMPAIRLSGSVLIVTGIVFILNPIEAPPAIGETVVYQATMPGIAEEPIFRGVFLSLLLVALGGSLSQDKFTWTRATVGAVLITTLVFGLVHGLSIDGGIHFQIEEFIFTSILGGLFAWLRLYTGSLLFPIILHNAVNTLAFLIAFAVH